MSLKKTATNNKTLEKPDENQEIIVDAKFVDTFIKEYKLRNLHKRPENDPFLFGQKEIDFIKLYEKQLMGISFFLIKNAIDDNKPVISNEKTEVGENNNINVDENTDNDSKSLKKENFGGDIFDESTSIAKDDMVINRQLFHLITSYLKYSIQARGADETFKSVGVQTAFSKEEKKILNAQNAAVLAL